MSTSVKKPMHFKDDIRTVFSLLNQSMIDAGKSMGEFRKVIPDRMDIPLDHGYVRNIHGENIRNVSLIRDEPYLAPKRLTKPRKIIWQRK